MPAHEVPRRQAVGTADHDLAHALALHDLAQLDWCGIGRPFIHPPAHVGVEREPDRAHQRLAGPWPGRRRFVDREVLGHRRALGSADQEDAAVGVGRSRHGEKPGAVGPALLSTIRARPPRCGCCGRRWSFAVARAMSLGRLRLPQARAEYAMAETVRELLASHPADAAAILAPERPTLELRRACASSADATVAKLNALGHRPRRPGGHRAAERAGDGDGLRRRRLRRHHGTLEPGLPGRGVRLLPLGPARQGAGRGRGRRGPRGRGGAAARCGRAATARRPLERPAGWFELRGRAVR